MSAVEVEASDTIEKNALGIEYNTACLIGTRLKESREDSAISKEYIARKAKIRERYIDAIELGDWDVLPPGLNGRGLVRLYAKELGVSLPEFEGFSNLQTIQAEKQSENLSQSNFVKKSRYQPAAEESAEIIKIVPRSEYKSAAFEDGISNNYNSNREISPSSVQNKLYQTKTHHAAAIVTPKISDIIGLDLSALGIENSIENKEIEKKKDSNLEKSNLNVLPLAKPINKSKKAEPIKIESPQINQAIAESPVAQLTAEIQKNQSASKLNNASEQIKPQKITYKKIIFYALAPLVVVGIVYGVYRINIQEHKLESQPLLTSERQLVNPQEQKNSGESAPGIGGPEHSAQDKTSLSMTAQPSTVLPPVAIERSVKVDIIAKVKLQIEADGKEVFSGYRQPGSLEFNFKDKAEILVYDASKVKLTYGAWDHGELGWNERKRKITLNAKPYQE